MTIKNFILTLVVLLFGSEVVTMGVSVFTGRPYIAPALISPMRIFSVVVIIVIMFTAIGLHFKPLIFTNVMRILSPGILLIWMKYITTFETTFDIHILNIAGLFMLFAYSFFMWKWYSEYKNEVENKELTNI